MLDEWHPGAHDGSLCSWSRVHPMYLKEWEAKFRTGHADETCRWSAVATSSGVPNMSRISYRVCVKRSMRDSRIRWCCRCEVLRSTVSRASRTSGTFRLSANHKTLSAGLVEWTTEIAGMCKSDLYKLADERSIEMSESKNKGLGRGWDAEGGGIPTGFSITAKSNISLCTQRCYIPLDKWVSIFPVIFVSLVFY